MSVTFYANSIQKVGFDAAAEPSISDQVATMSGGETTGALYDLLDNRRTNKLSIDTSGETQAATIQIETTAAIGCTAAIIDNHNLKSADANYILGESASVIAITSAYSGTLGSAMSADTLGGAGGNTLVTVVADGISLCRFDIITGDTWQWVINDTDTFDADITMGEICLSAPFAPAFNPELQWLNGYDMPGSSYRESEGGQRYGFSTHTNARKSWRMTWKYMSDTNKGLLQDIFLFTRGTRNPFYIDLSGPLGAATPQLFYVRFMKPLSFTGLTKDAWQVSVDIEEEI